LVDAGLSCRETERRLERQGLSILNVKGLFISHEHTDHTKGVEVIARKHKIPVFITATTHRNSLLKIEHPLLRHFSPHIPVFIGNLKIVAFPKNHDASEPHSFTIEGAGLTVGVMTDIGSPCEHLVRHFRQCHAAFLEANYDDKMLEEGNYPVHLKRRIRGENGHLSNRQALNLFLAYRPAFMSHLILSHLSQNNNRPGLVLELFIKHAGNTRIEVASRNEETDVFAITV